MTTITPGDVAAEVRAWRARRSRTQADVASHIPMRQDTYSRKERGLSPFTVPELLAIAECLDIPPADLFVTKRSPHAAA